MSFRHLRCLPACLLTLGACSSAGEPLTEAEVERLLPGNAAAVRMQLEIEIEGEALRGTFVGVLVARATPPAVRFQLLPDFGTAILDVIATPSEVTGTWHGDAVAQTWRGSSDDPPLSPLLLFGITLLEQHAAITRDRVRGSERGPPPKLHLLGCFPATEVVAEVKGNAVAARDIRRGYVTWRACSYGDHGTVDAPGFTLRARVIEREAADDLHADVFRLSPVR